MSKVKTNKKYYHKQLVRDKIPDIIESDEGFYRSRTLRIKDYRKLLRKKALEEARELQNVNKKNLIKELADVLQVLQSIAEFEKITFETVERARKKREEERGAFKKRIFLIWSNKPAGRE